METIRTCPDCKEPLGFNSKYGVWMHKTSKCAYMEDKEGERVWDNQKREEYLKKILDRELE